MGAILNITNQIGELIKSSRVSIGCNLTASKQSEVPISSNNVSAIENFTNKTGSEPIIMIF
jgi:hypothetical protein